MKSTVSRVLDQAGHTVTAAPAALTRSVPAAIAALLAVACIAVALDRSGFAIHSDLVERNSSGKEVAVADFLIRPFISEAERGEIFIDGGAVMIADERFPRLRFGDSSAANPLQLAMIMDCTQSASRETLRRLHDLYGSSMAATLPSLELYLLPVHQTAEAKELHQTLLVVNLSSSQPQCLITIVAELADGTLAPAAAAVTSRIATLEPALYARWEGLIKSRSADLEKAFESARIQLHRNAPHLSDATLPQATVLDAVMVGKPKSEDLARFLISAANRQNKYLASAEGATRVSTVRPCNCANTGHDHTLSTSSDPTLEKALDARTAPPQRPSPFRRSAPTHLPLKNSQASS